MKAIKEEDIQQLAEQQFKKTSGGLSPGNEDDIALYGLLFNALAEEPDGLQSTGLANAVVEQIIADKKTAESIRYNIVIAAVVVAGLAAAYFSLSYVDPATLKSVVGFITVYKWIALFIILCFALIETADKNLVKRKLMNC